MPFALHTFDDVLTLTLGNGGETQLDVSIDYQFVPGEPETRFSPGQSDDVEIARVRLFLKGVELPDAPWLRAIVETDDILREALIEDGRSWHGTRRTAA